MAIKQRFDESGQTQPEFLMCFVLFCWKLRHVTTHSQARRGWGQNLYFILVQFCIQKIHLTTKDMPLKTHFGIYLKFEAQKGHKESSAFFNTLSPLPSYFLEGWDLGTSAQFTMGGLDIWSVSQTAQGEQKRWGNPLRTASENHIFYPRLPSARTEQWQKSKYSAIAQIWMHNEPPRMMVGVPVGDKSNASSYVV